MNTFTWRTNIEMIFSLALNTALLELQEHQDSDKHYSIERFVAFKVNGLWVVTITYK